jgi:hypothetical protein
MTADEVAAELFLRWIKSLDRQRVVTVDEIAAFMSGVKAVLAIEDWRPIATITRADIDTRTVLWNPCDGVHLINVATAPVRELELLKSEGIFTHYLKLEPPSANTTDQ